jgi:GTP-binding protein EngB required for normal cell division
VIVANKIDKIKKSEYDARLEKIDSLARGLPVIPYSSIDRTGVEELTEQILA